MRIVLDAMGTDHAPRSEVAGAVGMTPSYFSRLYTSWFGHPPTDDLAT